MLKKTVKSGCALGFRQNLEPLMKDKSDGGRGWKCGWALTLLDGAQLFFEVNIKRGGSHLFLLRLSMGGT